MSVTCQAEEALCPAPTRLLSKIEKEIVVVFSVAIRASWGHFCPHTPLGDHFWWCPSKTSPVPDLFFFLGWWCLAGAGDGKACKQKRAISPNVQVGLAQEWFCSRPKSASHYPWFAPGSSPEQEKLAFPSRRKDPSWEHRAEIRDQAKWIFKPSTTFM